MRKYTLLALVIPSIAYSQEPEVKAAFKTEPILKVPAQVQAMPGEDFLVAVETNLKWTRWTVPSGLVRVKPEWTAFGDKAFVGRGPAGVYEFTIEGTLNDEYRSAKCVVFVGTPTPTPTPAPVNDPLYQALQALYTADQGEAKAADRNALAGVYRDGVKFLGDAQTAAQLFEALRKVSQKQLSGPTALLPIRNRLNQEHAALFPTGASTPLTEELRKRIASHFLQVASVLEALK